MTEFMHAKLMGVERERGSEREKHFLRVVFIRRLCLWRNATF